MELSRIIGKNGKCYDFINIIGRGAFGEVWKATCKYSNEDFAIKVVNNKGLEYCQQETNIHRKLWHDSILQFYEEINSYNSKYLILEYCPNGNLQEYIDKNNNVSEVQARLIFKRVANGVAYLHYKNIVHRDLKPANLLLSSNMDVKIADFGQAVELNGNLQCTGLYGTVPYYSPEMLEHRPYRTETDCWSLGCILYFLLAGKPPFSCSQTGRSIRNGDYLVLSRLSHSANNLIQSLLTKDQEKRMPAYDILQHPFILQEKAKLATYSFDNGIQSGITSTNNIQNTQMPFRCHSAGISSGLGSMTSSGLSSFRKNDKNSTDSRNFYGNSPPVRLSPSPQHVVTNQKITPILKENLLPNKHIAVGLYSNDKKETRIRPVHGRERDVSEERRRMKLLHEERFKRSYDTDDEFIRKPYKESPQNVAANQKIFPVLKENLLPNKHHINNQYCNDKRETQLRPAHTQGRGVLEEKCMNYLEEDRNKNGCCDEFVRRQHSGSCSPQDRNEHVQQHGSPSHSELNSAHKNGSSSSRLCKKCSGKISNERICHEDNSNSAIPSVNNNDNHSCSSNKSDHSCHGSHHSGSLNHNCKCRNHCTSGKHVHHGCSSACSCSSNCCEAHHQPEQNSFLATNAKNGIANHLLIDYSSKCSVPSEDYGISRPNSDAHKKQMHHKHQQSLISSSQETCTSVLQNLPSPIKLARLKPQRIRLNNNMYTILENGQLCVEVIGNNFHGTGNNYQSNLQENVIAMYIISEDGMKVVRYKPRGVGLPLSDWPHPIPPRACNSFSYDNLPRKYWKVYHVASKFINFMRSTTRKVTFYTQQGSFTLMENGPDADFVGCFNSGGKIKKSGDSIQITHNGNLYNVNSEDEVYSLEEEIINMWRHFCECHEHCRKIEADMERNTENDIFSRFPLTIGSQKHPVRAIKNECTSPSLYSPISNVTSETSTVLTDATNMIRSSRYPEELRKNKVKLEENQCDMKVTKNSLQRVKSKLVSKNDVMQRRVNPVNQDLPRGDQLCNGSKKACGKINKLCVNRIDKLSDHTTVVYSDSTKISFSKTKPVDKVYYWTHEEWKCYSVNEPRMIKELPPDLRQRLAVLGPEKFRDIGIR